MDFSGRDHLLLSQWKNAVAECKENLKERRDIEQVEQYTTWNDVRRQVGSGHESAMLMSSLKKLKDFMERVLCPLNPELERNTFWGLCRLTLKLSYDYDVAVRQVARMLKDIGHRVEALSEFRFKAQEITFSLKEACMECATVVLYFFSEVIKFLRTPDLTISDEFIDDEWKTLQSQFAYTINDLDDILSRTSNNLSTLLAGLWPSSRTEPVEGQSSSRAGAMQALVHTQPAEVHTSIRAAGLPSPGLDESVKFPCVVLPLSFSVQRFFNREDTLAKLEDHFANYETSEFRSVLIHGLGGVGKSSIALHFAEKKRQRNELDALFWIHAENLISIKQSFTRIATKLKLADARARDDDHNTTFVLDWLAETSCRWFLIYDNVESKELLRAHWPSSTHGQAIVTARNHSVGFDLVDGTLEIMKWDEDTATRYFFHLLARDIGADVEQTDRASAIQLSRKLDGHALAISVAAAMIHQRRWTVSDFMKVYDEHPSEMLEVSGSRSINALWKLSFQTLSSNGRIILGILSYMASDSIPQALFDIQPKDKGKLDNRLKFCEDSFEVSNALEDLLAGALIRVDRSTQTFSVHRLVQDSFRFSLSPSERQQAWLDAANVLCLAFPLRDAESAQMYLHSERCAMYLQHVLCIGNAVHREQKLNPSFHAFEAYCHMNNSCSRYLLEINAYNELQDLIKANEAALSNLPDTPKQLYMESELTSYKGQMFMKMGQAKLGLYCLRNSYEGWCNVIPFEGIEAAWAAENLANCVASDNDYLTAIAWHERAEMQWKEWSSTQTLPVPVSPILKKSLCQTLLWHGDIARARRLALEALLEIEQKVPFNWAMAAYLKFILGSIARRNGEYGVAEQYFTEAQNSWLEGNKLKTDPFNAACLFRKGCVALSQGKVGIAIRHLRDAIEKTDTKKSVLVAEHARCLFKLSEALEQEPRGGAEAQREYEEAFRMLEKLNPNASAPLTEDIFDQYINILWR